MESAGLELGRTFLLANTYRLARRALNRLSYQDRHTTNLKCDTKSKHNIDDELVCRLKIILVIGKYGVSELDTGEHGTGEDGIGEHGIGEHGIGEYGIGEHGIGEHGIGEHGIGKHGIGERGIGERGIGEHGLGKPGIGEHGNVKE